MINPLMHLGNCYVNVVTQNVLIKICKSYTQSYKNVIHYYYFKSVCPPRTYKFVINIFTIKLPSSHDATPVYGLK